MKDSYFDYSAKTKSKDVVEIHIFGVIGLNEKWYGDGTNNKAFALVSLIKKLDKEYNRINVHINSPGGSIADGLAIYNALKACKAEIHTYNAGFIGSMASIIYLAGKTHAPTTSIYHLHAALTRTEGNIRDHQKAIEVLEVFESTLKTAVAERTGMTVEEVHNKWFDGNDYFMNSEKAAEFGFVDQLEETEAEPPADEKALKNMAYNQIIALYDTENSTDKSRLVAKKKGFINTVKESAKSILNINNKNSENMSNPLKFKAKLTVLLAVLGFEHFVLNSNNKVEMSIDEAHSINDALESKEQEILALTEQRNLLEEDMKVKNQQITDLKAKLDGTPVNTSIPSTPDNSTATSVVDGDIDDDVSRALHNYNKEQGITK